VGAVPLMPVENRIAGHVRLLGIFWLAISAFRLIPGLFLVSIFRYGMPFMGPGIPGFVQSIIQAVGGLLLVGAVIGLVAGWGLLERQPWARTLAIVVGCFSLLDMPFGTALGIYTLWVLLPARSEEEYRQIARAA
jgi:hypothetical protein